MDDISTSIKVTLEDTEKLRDSLLMSNENHMISSDKFQLVVYEKHDKAAQYRVVADRLVEHNMFREHKSSIIKVLRSKQSG